MWMATPAGYHLRDFVDLRTKRKIWDRYFAFKRFKPRRTERFVKDFRRKAKDFQKMYSGGHPDVYIRVNLICLDVEK